MTEASPNLKGQTLRCFVQLLGKLPLSVSRSVGGCVGWFNYVFNTRLTQTTRTNISRCFPALNKAQRERLIKQSVIETGRVGTEIPGVWLKPQSWLQSKILNVRNRELLGQKLADDAGLVFLVPHLGNWELFSLYISSVTEMTTLYQPPKIAEMETLIRTSREREGARLVPTNNKGVMALFKALKAGGTTMILPDQVPPEEGGEFTSFFGLPARTMSLPHGLIKRTGCQVLMAYAIRVPGGFEIVFEEPDAGIYHEDTQASLEAMNRSVEACVNACPSQYQWEYKRFRKQPAGMPKFYG
jgi:Kdo2-lipid IVA lauroyltransferase/acyltransferase